MYRTQFVPTQTTPVTTPVVPSGFPKQTDARFTSRYPNVVGFLLFVLVGGLAFGAYRILRLRSAPAELAQSATTPAEKMLLEQQDAVNPTSASAIYLWANTSIATQNINDLDLWIRASPTRIIGGGERVESLRGEGDTSARTELLLSRRIVSIGYVARVRIRRFTPNVAEVEVVSGVSQGVRGYVYKPALMHYVEGSNSQMESVFGDSFSPLTTY